MKKHRRKWLILVVTTVGVAVGVVLLSWAHLRGSGPRINPYTATKIRLGMTQGQIEAIFAAPPGDYSTAPMVDQPPTANRPQLRREDWTTDEGGAAVFFGPDGTVADCIIWIAPHHQQASRFERVRKWWYEVTP
jgi:hypothetical protein